MTKATEQKVTYEIERLNGDKLRVTVPAAWKVTFGPVFQSSGRGMGFGSPNYALRFYEAENKQRAVFVDVASFRDLSIPVQRLDRTVTEEKKAKRGSKIVQASEMAVVDEKWENE